MAPPAENRTWDHADAKRALAEDKYDDCTSCRVMGMFPNNSFSPSLTCRSLGSAAFIGLGAYSYQTGMSNLRKQEKAIMQGATKYKMGSRKLGIIAISATLVGMGVLRAVN